ncbi:hypothetical protein C5B91_16150 [Haloferax sp. Atlit-10N]|uniref:hypothetical protein n=1 Tax=Haloferax TaxID=2251 RepID=UPI0006778243|nr:MULTISPECIES: hypothetical protein [Haloferax]RDZ42324.1 hypothetical protein C5B86_16720 [Haloferax sp. Atlit-19N]RDZ42607.1 hypothetical protein C5B87_16980 [Haloferax sp. Atlit-16N]RDZ57480.1 hypothetical protein C5B91_16150 [Haloferax sp. Atlit-10N]
MSNSNPPWTAEFAALKSDCAVELATLLEKYPQPVVYEVMSEMLRREMRDQFAVSFAESQFDE